MALNRFAGYASVNNEDMDAETSACVLVIVIVNNAVPPALTDATEKFLEIVGLDCDTASTSAAEHTPATVHDADTLVLATLDGGVIEAVLTT